MCRYFGLVTSHFSDPTSLQRNAGWWPYGAQLCQHFFFPFSFPTNPHRVSICVWNTHGDIRYVVLSNTFPELAVCHAFFVTADKRKKELSAAKKSLLMNEGSRSTKVPMFYCAVHKREAEARWKKVLTCSFVYLFAFSDSNRRDKRGGRISSWDGQKGSAPFLTCLRCPTSAVCIVCYRQRWRAATVAGSSGPPLVIFSGAVKRKRKRITNHSFLGYDR